MAEIKKSKFLDAQSNLNKPMAARKTQTAAICIAFTICEIHLENGKIIRLDLVNDKQYRIKKGAFIKVYLKRLAKLKL